MWKDEGHTRVETLGTGPGTVEDGVASVDLERTSDARDQSAFRGAKRKGSRTDRLFSILAFRSAP